MKRKLLGASGISSLKVDMAKAYDRVEWNFIRCILGKLGFPSLLVNFIMRSVTSVSYKLTHSEGDFQMFQPQRGLRQGDPVSPYLFLICAEGLSALIRDRISVGSLHGCKLAPNHISYLLMIASSTLKPPRGKLMS